MKMPWFAWIYLGALALCVCWHEGYRHGQQRQRQFQALCEAVGTRCVVQVTPEYVAVHSRGIDTFPYVTYEWREDRTFSMSSQSACIPGEIQACFDGRYWIRETLPSNLRSGR